MVTQVLTAVASYAWSSILQFLSKRPAFVTRDMNDRQWCAMQAKIDRSARAVNPAAVHRLTAFKL
jgi:hypothetical protein